MLDRAPAPAAARLLLRAAGIVICAAVLVAAHATPAPADPAPDPTSLIVYDAAADQERALAAAQISGQVSLRLASLQRVDTVALYLNDPGRQG